jgi:hypothetical protein
MKNPLNKNQGWNPSIKSTQQMRTQVDATQRKKTKANNEQNFCKNPTQRGLMAMKQQSTITKKISNERVVIYHKSTNDGGALTMMCGRDEKPRQ